MITLSQIEANRNQYTPGHYKNVIYAIDNDVTSDDRYLQPDLPLSDTRRQIAQLPLHNAVLRHKDNERRTAIVHAQTDDDVPESECGKRWKVYRNTIANVKYELIRCHKCDDCHKYKGNNDRMRVTSRALERLKENPDLKLQYVDGIPPDKVEAFQKRIQRDKSAEYHRSINEDDSFTFFVQSEEEKYGDVIELETVLDEKGLWNTYNLEEVHDFKKAVKVAQDKEKRQTGGLFKKRSEDDDDEEKFIVRIPAFEAVNKEDQDKLDKIVEDVKPLAYATDEKSYQKCHYNYAFTIDRIAQERGIPIKISMLLRSASQKKIDKYNENISKFRREKGLDTSECPNKEHIKSDSEVVYAPYLDNSDTDSEFEQLALSFTGQ